MPVKNLSRIGRILLVVVIVLALGAPISTLAANQMIRNLETTRSRSASRRPRKPPSRPSSARTWMNSNTSTTSARRSPPSPTSRRSSALYGSSKVTPFTFTFHIIEDKDVNAFSLPGGFIYVNQGLLDFVQSDQELAAVLGHEITHAAHHHMVYLLKKQAAMNNEMAMVLLAAVLGGKVGKANTGDMANVMYGAQLFQIAKLNGYGMEAERDADHGGVYFMKQAGYNPVGMLTFLERLAKRPELVTYGILQNHPLDDERIEAAKVAIEQLGVPINRRQTTKAICAVVRTETVDGAAIPEVVLEDKVIYRPLAMEGKTAEQRANATADAINGMLDADLQIHELRVDPTGGVIARNQALMVVTDEEAKLMRETPDAVAQAAADIIRDVIWKQMVDTVH